MANISLFQFKFWQPVKFFDNVGFRWVMARCIGIAWFKVWSEPNGDWAKGHEFTRNVVRNRLPSEMSTLSEETLDMKNFKFQKKVQSKKR